MFDACITFVPTRDLAACARFYEQVIGLALTLDQGGIRIYQVAGGGFIGFSQQEAPMAEPGRVVLTLVTDDVDGWHARVTAAGAATDGPPRENPRYRIYHFYLKDPDGYSVEIQRFLHPFP